MALEVRLMAPVCSAAAPVHPQPLLGMFADPSFDHGRDRLHCALEVDLPVSVARWLDGFGEINAKAMVGGQADDAGAMNRALDMTREAGDERIGFAAAAAEGHRYPLHRILCDDDCHLARRLEPPPRAHPR